MAVPFVVVALAFLSLTLVAASPASLIPTATTPWRSTNPLEALSGAISSLVIPDNLLTNAERLSRGLPPRAPKRHYVNAAHALAPRSSPVPCRRGYIRVDGPGTTTRWFGAVLNSFGEYAPASAAVAREVLSICSEGAGPFNIATALGLPLGVPYVGATTGFANTSPDLGPGSYNYAYFTRTEGTQPHAPPVQGANTYSMVVGVPQDIESAIWTLSTQTGQLFPRWVNRDGSTPPVTVVYVASSDAYAITGSIAQFEASFGSVDVVTLFWVPEDDVVAPPPPATTTY